MRATETSHDAKEIRRLRRAFREIVTVSLHLTDLMDNLVIIYLLAANVIFPTYFRSLIVRSYIRIRIQLSMRLAHTVRSDLRIAIGNPNP